MSQVGTVNIVNTIICVAIAQLFDSAVVGGRESLVFKIQIQTPVHTQYAVISLTLRLRGEGAQSSSSSPLSLSVKSVVLGISPPR